MPPGVGHNGDAGLHARLGRRVGRELDGAVDHQHLAHARHLLYLVEVGGFDFAAKDRALLDRGVEHARQRDIDAEERLAADDGVGVDAGLRLANDGVVFRVFERDLVEHRAGKRGGFAGELSIGEGFAGGLVQHAAGLSRALGEGNSPSCRSRGYEHLAAGRSYAAQRIPGLGSGGAAAGGLAAVGGLVEVSLLHTDVLPVDIELFGDEHGQLGLDALAHFGSAGFDGDGAVGGDFDEGGRLQVALFGGLGAGGRDVETEGEASAGQGADFQKRSAIHGGLS